MYTRQEREGILWEFHRSGLSVRRACATLPLFPNPDNLYRWLGLERSGELVAREMPDRASRAPRRPRVFNSTGTRALTTAACGLSS